MRLLVYGQSKVSFTHGAYTICARIHKTFRLHQFAIVILPVHSTASHNISSLSLSLCLFFSTVLCCLIRPGTIVCLFLSGYFVCDLFGCINFCSRVQMMGCEMKIVHETMNATITHCLINCFLSWYNKLVDGIKHIRLEWKFNESER